MNTKKIVYVSLFTLLGLLAQFFVHAVIEILYIYLLLNYYSIFSFGFSLNAWATIHIIFGVVLLIGGFMFGFWQGTFWWKRIYGSKLGL